MTRLRDRWFRCWTARRPGRKRGQIGERPRRRSFPPQDGGVIDPVPSGREDGVHVGQFHRGRDGTLPGRTAPLVDTIPEDYRVFRRFLLFVVRSAVGAVSGRKQRKRPEGRCRDDHATSPGYKT